jgi:hypothetical protein
MNPIIAALLSVFCALIFAGLANLGLSLFKRYANHETIHSNRDVAGMMFGAVSLIYSLILAFVIVAVWGDYESLTNTTEKEGVKLSSLLMHASALPDSLARPIIHGVREYDSVIVFTDWEKLPKVGVNRGILRRMYQTIAAAQSINASEQRVLDDVSSDISDVSDLRRERSSHQRSHVPLSVWVMLIAGSIVVIVFSFYLSTDRLSLHRTWITMFSFIIGLCLFMVYMLDKPFVYTGIDKAPYEQVLTAAKRMNK